MKTNDVEMQTFVREGLERYYFDAKESVTAFETSLKNQLTELIQAMPACPTFPAKGRQLGKPGIWTDGETMSVYARLVANDEACLELGIEWGTFEHGRPVLYATWPDWKSSTLWVTQPKPPVQNHADEFLFVPVDDGFQLEKAARALLAEAVRALGKVKTVR